MYVQPLMEKMSSLLRSKLGKLFWNYISVHCFASQLFVCLTVVTTVVFGNINVISVKLCISWDF